MNDGKWDMPAGREAHREWRDYRQYLTLSD